MTELLIFVVERAPAGETPALYHDELPAAYRGKHARENGLVYALRLDRLPDTERWCAMPLADLYARYCQLRDAGKLPAQNITDPPLASSGSRGGRLIGEWWTQPVVPWDQTVPADPDYSGLADGRPGITEKRPGARP